MTQRERLTISSTGPHRHGDDHADLEVGQRAHEAHDGDLEFLAKQSEQLAHKLQELQ